MTKIIKILENDNTQLFEWLRDTLIEKLCNCPRNKTVMFKDKEKRICGSTNKVEISDPQEDDVKKSIMLMQTISSFR